MSEIALSDLFNLIALNNKEKCDRQVNVLSCSAPSSDSSGVGVILTYTKTCLNLVLELNMCYYEDPNRRQTENKNFFSPKSTFKSLDFSLKN